MLINVEQRYHTRISSPYKRALRIASSPHHSVGELFPASFLQGPSSMVSPAGIRAIFPSHHGGNHIELHSLAQDHLTIPIDCRSPEHTEIQLVPARRRFRKRATDPSRTLAEAILPSSSSRIREERKSAEWQNFPPNMGVMSSRHVFVAVHGRFLQKSIYFFPKVLV